MDQVPTGPDWQYEPKWDGFRCIAFRHKASVALQSKAQKGLTRYFPEIKQALEDLKAAQFVLDGELVVPVDGKLNFDQLLQRIHPAESRVLKLMREHPAVYIVFDMLADDRGHSLLDHPLRDRRRVLESFAKKYFKKTDLLQLSPATTRLAEARRWFRSAGGDLDGLIAKRLDVEYRPGDRDGMVKVKPMHTADCVVGGFRYARQSADVGSMLLGLYDGDGLLHHVGFTATLKHTDRPALTRKLEKLVQAPGFTGRSPGGPSRWSTERSTQWEPLRPKLVVEIEFDHFTGGRFRHGTSFLRWRPDKSPQQCTFDQVKAQGSSKLRLLISH